jgi:hypothetical protein
MVNYTFSELRKGKYFGAVNLGNARFFILTQKIPKKIHEPID